MRDPIKKCVNEIRIGLLAVIVVLFVFECWNMMRHDALASFVSHAIR